MSAVAENYAETLLELGLRDGAAEEYGDQLSGLVDLYRSEREFRLFLQTPSIDAAEKKSLLRDALADRVPETFLRFLLLVIEKRRQRALPEMERHYRDLLDEDRGRVRARVTLALEPDEELKDEIADRLAEMLDREVVAQFDRDEDILGGLVVRVGDRVLDASLRRRLQELRRAMSSTEDRDAA